MKSAILSLGLILLLILALTGCLKLSTEDLTSGGEDAGQQDQQLDESGEAEVLDDVNDEFIAEDDFVEIGEMI
jgi:hypothetical protein